MMKRAKKWLGKTWRAALLVIALYLVIKLDRVAFVSACMVTALITWKACVYLFTPLNEKISFEENKVKTISAGECNGKIVLTAWTGEKKYTWQFNARLTWFWQQWELSVAEDTAYLYRIVPFFGGIFPVKGELIE